MITAGSMKAEESFDSQYEDLFNGAVEATGNFEKNDSLREGGEFSTNALQCSALSYRKHPSDRREGYSLERMDGAKLAHKLHRQSSIKSSASFFSALSGGSIGRPIADSRTRSLQQVLTELGNLKTHRRCSCCRRPNVKSKEYWIRSGFANYLFGFVIIVNAGYIGFETNATGPSADMDIPQKFWTFFECCFLGIFVMELCLRCRADGLDHFKDFWGVFDTIIVMLGVVDTFLFQFLLDEDQAQNLQTLSLFRLGRLVRIARVLRILRILRFVRELLLLVKGLLGALKALIWAFLLIMMVLFISAIFVTEIIRVELDDLSSQDSEELSIWFGNVSRAVLTLSQIMTLEGWPRILRVVCLDGNRPWLLFFFFPFLCCTNFALLNVVTAVMVEKVFEFAEEEKTHEVKTLQSSRRQAIQKVCKLFTDIDEDGNGSLSASEMKSALQDPDAMKQFQELGIAKHDIDTLFQCLDVDGNGELSIEEFIEGCLRMHGEATSSDLLRVHYDVHRTRKSLKITKLTRHMMWSAWCLNDDYSKVKASEKRNKLRSKTGPAILEKTSLDTSVAEPRKGPAPTNADPIAITANADPTASRTSVDSGQSRMTEKSGKSAKSSKSGAKSPVSPRTTTERSSTGRRLTNLPGVIQQSLASLSNLVIKKDWKRHSHAGVDMVRQRPRAASERMHCRRRVSDSTHVKTPSKAAQQAQLREKTAGKASLTRQWTRRFAPEPEETAPSSGRGKEFGASTSVPLDLDSYSLNQWVAKTAAVNRSPADTSRVKPDISAAAGAPSDTVEEAKHDQSAIAGDVAAANSLPEKQPRQLHDLDVLLPPETTVLLEEVLAEQGQMRNLIEVLGSEMRMIRSQIKEWPLFKASYDGDALQARRCSADTLPEEAKVVGSMRHPLLSQTVDVTTISNNPLLAKLTEAREE